MKQIFLSGVMGVLFLLTGCGTTALMPTPDVQQGVDNNQTDQTAVGEDINTFHTSVTNVLKEDLVGAWSIIEGGNAEEIDMSADGTFATFLHERPFDNGTWKYDDGVLAFESDALGTQIYTDVVMEEGMIILEGESADMRQVWEEIMLDDNTDIDVISPEDIVGEWEEWHQGGYERSLKFLSDGTWIETDADVPGEPVFVQSGTWEFDSSEDILRLYTDHDENMETLSLGYQAQDLLEVVHEHSPSDLYEWSLVN